MPVRARLSVAVVGAIAGVVSGLLGVGGGVVLVPGLVLAAGLAQRRAHATSLAAIIPIGAVGAAVYWAQDGAVDLPIAFALAAGAVVGAPIGVRALARAPERTLRLGFVGVSFAVAIRLLVAP